MLQIWEILHYNKGFCIHVWRSSISFQPCREQSFGLRYFPLFLDLCFSLCKMSISKDHSVYIHKAGSLARPPYCPFSTHRTECTTGGAEAFWCSCAGLSLQSIWKTRASKELRDPYGAQVSACLGPCKTMLEFSFHIPPRGFSFWRLLG